MEFSIAFFWMLMLAYIMIWGVPGDEAAAKPSQRKEQ